MEEFKTWLIGSIAISHLLKFIFNWSVHNILNPKGSVKFGLNHPGTLFKKNGLEEATERNLMVVYCCFIFFWLKIPKQTYGKFLAWSVLVLSVIQIISIVLLIKFFGNN